MFKYKLMIIVIIIAVVASACGAKEPSTEAVQTAIAGTQQAMATPTLDNGALALTAIANLQNPGQQPTAVLPEPTVASQLTEVVVQSTTAPTEVPSISGNVEQWLKEREARLWELNLIFRGGNPEGTAMNFAEWLEAAGMPYNWTPGTFDARQPEEGFIEHDGQRYKVPVGIQVEVRGLYVPEPNCITTNEPDRVITQPTTKSIVTDEATHDKMYTNVTTAGNGEVTIYVDCRDWPELFQ